MILEGMQAGLSWAGILKKRENYRAALDGFDYEKIAQYDDAKLEELMQNEGIIRNRLKNKAIITNAQVFIKVREKHGSFDAFIWAYVEGKPIVNSLGRQEQIPAKDDLSERISKDLKKLGFKFVGPVIIYSYMQAIGIIDDHVDSCAFKSKMV